MMVFVEQACFLPGLGFGVIVGGLMDGDSVVVGLAGVVGCDDLVSSLFLFAIGFSACMMLGCLVFDIR